jgi:hypothetical protein
MMLGAIRSVIDTTEIEDAIEEKMNTMFEIQFRSYMQNISQERHLELQ